MEHPESGGSNRSTLVSPTSWLHPANRIHRFLALLLMCFLCFGSYFCYDTPGALADNFKDDSHLNTSQFALLYSIYSWPNVVLCFIGGYLVDRYFGVRLGTVIYMTIVFIGAVIFAFGVYINTYWLMILGRFVFGIGGESLQVAVNNYVVLWFKGKELNMVFGLQLSFSRFGSTVNFWVMEPIYRWVAHYYLGYERLGVTLFIASLTCFISLVCGVILGWMDYRAEKILGRQDEQHSDEPVHLKDIKHFKPVFWLLSVICVTYYLAIFPFIALGKLFFERKFDFLPQAANNVNSMVYLLSAALSPFFGILIDKTGRNMTWVIISIVTTISAHGVMAFTFLNPYIGVIILGISYSLLASGLWPLVALIVPENQLGTAYGMNQAISPITRLLLTLRFYATGSFLTVVGDFSGVSKASASRIIYLVSQAIARLRPEFIKFPTNTQEIQQEFYNIAKFPRLIGAIDCTHVPIKSPGGNSAEEWRNRKSQFSFNVQTVVSAKLKILDIVARWPGAAHDQTIFNNSLIKQRLQNGEFRNCMIVGDKGYENTSYLLTPLQIPMTPAEHLYNESQIRSRNVVERTYGVWKNRFPVLSKKVLLHVSHVQAVIVACAVLHNIAIDMRDDHFEVIESVDEPDGDVLNQSRTENVGDPTVRSNLINYYFASLLQ